MNNTVADRASIQTQSITSRMPNYFFVLEGILFLSLIISVNSVYWVNQHTLFKIIIQSSTLASSTILSIVSGIILTRRKISLGPPLLFILFWIVMTTPLFIRSRMMHSINNTAWISYLFFPICTIFYAYFMIRMNRWVECRKLFLNIVTVLALISIFFWVLGSLGIPYHNGVNISWGGAKRVYGFLGLTYFPQGSIHFIGISLLRNCGIFAEAPMYAFVLSVAVLVEELLGETSKRRLVILSIALLTTGSTTGLIALVLVLSGTLIINGGLSRALLLVATLVPIGVIALIVILSAKMSDGVVSVGLRSEDITAGYKAWQLHPWMGYGLGSVKAYYPFIAFWRVFYSVTGYSSGLMATLMQGGVYWLILYIGIPVIGFAGQSKHRALFAVIFLILLFQLLVYNTLLLTFCIVLMYMCVLTRKS